MKLLHLLTLLMLFVAQVFAANGTMKGDGSASKPFQIEDYEDLKAIGKGAYLYSSDYVLTKDIDASASKNEMCNEDGCNGFISIGKYKDAADSIIFWGNIDGQNHTISNLTIWLPCERDVAFISYLGGSVTNLNFDHIHVTGRVSESNFVASVAAKQMGSIKNVHVTNGFVQGQNYVGGIVGEGTNRYNEDAVLEDVSFQGDIKGAHRVGGIVGETDMNVVRASADVNIVIKNYEAGGIVGYLTGNVIQSRSSGTIVPDLDEVESVGGIAGYSKGTIEQSVSTMDMMHYGFIYFGYYVGGIVGENDGTVYASYALGSVEGEKNVGGVAGNGFVLHSFAMGPVRGKRNVGGVVGNGTVYYSYAANEVRGESLVGGLVGKVQDTIVSSYWNTEISGLDTSAGGNGLTTAQMMTLSSFAGWDTLGYVEYADDGTDTCSYYATTGVCYSPTGNFIHYWSIDEGKSFPYLNVNPFSAKSVIPVAVPTSAAKWQEQPKVASLFEVEGELVGKWLGWARLSDNADSIEYGSVLRRDSLYYGYRIGVVNGTDTVWGTSSYMAVPNKIKISTFAELQKIGNDIAFPLVADYELTKDIDASGKVFKPIGDTVHAFMGRFDGKNHTIKNLTIDEPNRDFTGLFGYAYGATIQNLTLQNTKVVGSWCVGALAGTASASIIDNVVSLNGDVKGVSSVGGLIGEAIGDSIHRVGTTGQIKGTEYVGGLIGDASSRLRDGFSVNVIKGFSDVGGIAGYVDSYSKSIYRVYSASMIKAPDGRGLAGFSLSSSLDSGTCFYDSTLAGRDRYGKTTAEMLKQETYVNYDFESVWEIQEGVSYPYFKGMNPILPGSLVDDGTVNMLAGDGNATNPYRIYDYGDLKYVGKYEYGLDAYYKLMGNINATASFKENCNADSTLCKGFEPIGEFSGVFIGGNKIIAGLNINRADEDSVGLFRALAKGAKVTGIVFDTASYFGESYSYEYDRENGVIRGKNYVGTLAGVDNGAELENIYVKYEIHGADYVGGVAGKKTSGSIVRSASRYIVDGDEYVGGLFGNLDQATMEDCFSISRVTGSKYVGGLVGASKSAAVKNSFAAGAVDGTSKWGGIVGDDAKSTYTSVYYDSIPWLVNVTAAGELLNSRQMVKKETYKNWDFEKTWRIAQDTTYPYFAWLRSNSYLAKTMDERIRPNLDYDTTMMQMAGSGTKEDPFLVKTYSDLKSIGFGKYKLSAVYQLANDIDASASATEVIEGNAAKGFKPIGEIEYFGRLFGDYGGQDTEPFSGKFYGNGFSIDNLTVMYDRYNPLGFIDTLAPSGVIENLTFKNYTVANMSGGGVVGTNYGVIKNVHVEATFDSTYSSAGIAFYNGGSIESCSFKGVLNGESSFAGMAVVNDGKITKAKVDVSGTMSSFAGVSLINGGHIDKASVTANVEAEWGSMGGIVGLNRSSGRVSGSSAEVDIHCANRRSGSVSYYKGLYQEETLEFDGIGGVVAIDSGKVSGSTATGSIDAPGSINVGGLIGAAYGKDIDGAHASVNLTASLYVGGLIGYNGVNVSNSYATGEVKSMAGYSGGFVGRNEGVIESSFATGNADGAAGFAGINYGTIKQSYSTGDVYGKASFVEINQLVIEDCYSVGDVYFQGRVAENAGFISTNGNSTAVRGYATGAVIHEDVRYCVGLPKISQPSDEFYYLAENCIDTMAWEGGLSHDKMLLKKSYSSFDFKSVWDIDNGATYPVLRNMPNVPFVEEKILAYENGKSLVKNVRKELIKASYVSDSSATKVLWLDSTSASLLDSLEKVKNVSGKYEVSYRVGMIYMSDTIWSGIAKAEIWIDTKTDVRKPVPVYAGSFGAAFRGGNVALRFELHSDAAVKFLLLDMQGRVLKSFDLGRRAAGAYFETLAADGVARGRYVGVLQVGGGVAERTLMFQK
jgi:hypothetical protein